MANRQLLFIIANIIFYSLSRANVFASTVVSVSNSSCKYSIELPQGWDTIPKEALKEKVQFNADLGIYPVAQKEYFSGNYAVFAFIPTLKTLTSLPFDQITSEIKKQSQQSDMKNDTLSVRFIQTVPETKNGKYTLCNYYKIQHNQDSIDNCQLLRLTKFGYISGLIYKKLEAIFSIEEITALLSGAISVQPDYVYSEAATKAFGLKQILISLAIGVIVYVLIAGLSKLKKQK